MNKEHLFFYEIYKEVVGEVQRQRERRMYARYAKLNYQKIGSIVTSVASHILLVNT